MDSFKPYVARFDQSSIDVVSPKYLFENFIRTELTKNDDVSVTNPSKYQGWLMKRVGSFLP
jgi:hypothetical protein